MPSPFPGMDPYLERHWGDVHHSLVTYARDQLQPELPAGLRARVEERVVVAPQLGPPRNIYPDVRIVETAGKRSSGANGRSMVAVAEPLRFLLDESETQGFIEIRNVTAGGSLITVIEILSPTNKKPGEGQDQYLRKQRELMDGGVSLVEIDLLREGDWVLAMPRAWLKPYQQTPYRALVQRATQPRAAEYYPLALTERLPAIRIPLRAADEDVPLDLQALIDKCYANGGYDDIDYTQPPDPPLTAQESRWAKRVLTQGKPAKPKNRKRKS